MEETFKQHKLLIALTFAICLGVIIFDIFHYSTSFGIVEINNINSLLLVPFIVLVCWLGMILGSDKQSADIAMAYQNKFTAREKEVFIMIKEGKKNQEIADELFVDLSTVKSHINSIYKKSGAKNRKELQFLGKQELSKAKIS